MKQTVPDVWGDVGGFHVSLMSFAVCRLSRTRAIFFA